MSEGTLTVERSADTSQIFSPEDIDFLKKRAKPKPWKRVLRYVRNNLLKKGVFRRGKED